MSKNRASRPSQNRRWVFTVNNPTGDIVSPLEPLVEYMVVGNEVAPQTGTPHLQGYCFLKTKMRRSQLSKLLPTAWLQEAKGSHQDNFDYCTKAKDFKEYGKFPEESSSCGKKFWNEFIASARAGTAEDTHPQQFVQYHAFVIKMMKENPPKVDDLATLDNVWFVGEAGAGKSRKARADYPDFFDKSINKWWDGYQGQPTVLLDDFDKSHSVLAHHVKRWSDRYAFSAEIKGSYDFIRPQRIVVTSQYTIDEIWDDAETRAAMHRRFRTERVGPPPVHVYFTSPQGDKVRVA